MSAEQFSKRLPKGLVGDPKDYPLVHEQFKQLVEFNIGKDLERNRAIHSKNWYESNEGHRNAIWTLKDTKVWQAAPWESIKAISTRATEFARSVPWSMRVVVGAVS